MIENFDWKINVYIDYSNIFHARYTLWWSLSIGKMINYFLWFDNINQIKFYWAYDPKNLNQTQWYKNLQNTFKNDKRVYFYLKKLEQKWEKNKWNVDTEMWFDIAMDIHDFDNVFLFSWDGDFKHIVDQLINKYTKKVFLFSTKLHVAWELVNFTQNFSKDICCFYDINNDLNSLTSHLKSIYKDEDKGIIIFKEFLELIDTLDNDEIEEIINYYKWILWLIDYNHPPKYLIDLKNKNKFSINKIIVKYWKDKERELLIEYLENIIS